MSETQKCGRCGAPLPPDSPEGLCPRCLMALNLATQTEMPGETGPAKPSPTPPLAVAEVAKLFPQLEILECLGRGGMGAVYKARQPRLDRLVALKILSPEKQGNQKFAERFEREARALAKLHHPNIVTVYDFGIVGLSDETGGTPALHYLLMEYVDGLTLRQVLQAGKLSPTSALAIVPKICEALQYAHDQGIVHRDIKPENILMDKEGRVKIADFGIAKILGDGGRANLSAEQIIGTPHYMSPEQIERPQAVDHRADIYSLGVVFYEMLTGELPLGKFQPPSKKVQVDVRLDEIVLRALEKEPERRYQQASDVKTQVETVAATASRSSGRQPAQTENHSVPASAPPTAGQSNHFWRFIVILFLVIPALGLLSNMAIKNFIKTRNKAIQPNYFNAQFHIRVFEADAGLVDKLIPSSERQNGPSNTNDLVSFNTSTTMGNFTVTRHGDEATDYQVAEIDTDTLTDLLNGLAPKPGLLVDETNLVWSSFPWNMGQGVTWAYNYQNGDLWGSGSGLVSLAIRDTNGILQMRINHCDVSQRLFPNYKITPEEDLQAGLSYEGNAPKAGGVLAFLIPFVREGGAHYLVVSFEVKRTPQNEVGFSHKEEPIKSDYIGQTLFPLGDSIEITSVERSENQMTVYGQYNLVSHHDASLALYVTSTNSMGMAEHTEVEDAQAMPIAHGSRYFELVDAHVTPGLPHISMYADGYPFASVYFGTLQEAAQESQAGWITNVATSTETWSPTLAPGERPDFQNILTSAKDLMSEGSYEEALQHYLWYFDHSRNDPDQRGVRLSFALSDWVELGRRYPKARQALIEIRDADTRQFSEGRGYADLFQEVAGINQYLNDDEATVALFKTIEQSDSKLAGQCFWFAEDLLAQNGDYETCRKYMGDPQAVFDRIRLGWQNLKQIEEQNAARSQEQRKRFEAIAKTNSIYAHIPFFSPPPFADNFFVAQTRQLIQILVGTGDISEAENIQKEALATLNDPRLKSAVDDAEAKVKKQEASQTTNQPPVSLSSSNTNQPRVVSVWPPDGATKVDTQQVIRIRFDQPMKADDFDIMWLSGGFVTCGQPHYESSRNEFDVPVQLLPGRTNRLQMNWDNEGFRGTNAVPAHEFDWQLITKPFAPKPGAVKPRVVQILPASDETMSVLTLFQLTFDQPMTLDYGFPYLRGRAFADDPPTIISDFNYDASGRHLTIPVILPPDNETKLTLEGFYSADGVASDPVAIPCQIGTNDYSREQLEQFSTAAQDPRLKQLLLSMKAARAQLTSGIETVEKISMGPLFPDGDSFGNISVQPAVFKWQGTNQFYEDISDIMNMKAFILGTDGKTCWLYSDGQDDGRRLDSSPVASVADIDTSIADPFGLIRHSVQSAIAKEKLIYEGPAQLNGHSCVCVQIWSVGQPWPTGEIFATKSEWWIDSKTYLPMQLVQHAQGGHVTFRFRYEALNQPLPMAAFQPSHEGKADGWYEKKLGPREKRFFTIRDGCDGSMVGQIGVKGPNGTEDTGLN